MSFVESLFRWIHVVAGILWIGLLYFFNWVNSAFAPTMDGETKRKVVPELLPRTLYWFRWGAAYTWITGVLLLFIVYYHGGLLLEQPERGIGVGAIIMIVLTFLQVHLYDGLYKGPLKDPQLGFIGGIVLAFLFVLLARVLGGFGYRATAIHLGAAFGTDMAFNVWFRIWPAQQKVIAAVKNGETPDAEQAALAGLRSKHNTYMSVPLVFMMISQHALWAARAPVILLPVVVLVGWVVVHRLYVMAGKVQGF